jgi:hypothetical protein
LWVFKGNAQKSITFYGGAGVNTVLPNYTNAVELKNKGKGILSNSFNFETKFKFSNHFSLSLNYLFMKNHIRARFDDVQVTYFNRYTQSGGKIGSLTFVDDLYLHGHYLGVNLNYEVPFSKNTIIFSLGLNRGLFDSKRNKIDRYYESVPGNSSYSNINARQTSNLTGPKFMAANASVRYSRNLNEKFGLFAQAIFIYNIIEYSYEFTHSSLGWEDRYIYTYGNGVTAVNSYYTLSYHTLNVTFGIFYPINFRKNEKQ